MLLSPWMHLHQTVCNARDALAFDGKLEIGVKVSRATFKTTPLLTMDTPNASGHEKLNVLVWTQTINTAYADFCAAMALIPTFNTPWAAPTLTFHKDGRVSITLLGVNLHSTHYPTAMWDLNSLNSLFMRLESLAFLPQSTDLYIFEKVRNVLIPAANPACASIVYFQLSKLGEDIRDQDLPKTLNPALKLIPTRDIRKDIKGLLHAS